MTLLSQPSGCGATMGLRTPQLTLSQKAFQAEQAQGDDRGPPPPSPHMPKGPSPGGQLD